MSSSDDSDPENEIEEIRHFFPPEEWKEMSGYEKRSFVRAARNYKAMIRAGLEPKKPFFMLEKVEPEQPKPMTPPPKPKKPKEPKQANHTPTSVRASQRIHKMLNLVDDNKENNGVLYCDECQCEWMGHCPKHGPLKVIENTKVLEYAGPHLAAATLPPGLISQQPAARQDEGESGDAADGVEGVWAAELVPRRTLFGPYEGDAIALNKKAPSPPPNWMGLVRPVWPGRGAHRANLRALEFCGRLYFRSTRDIPAGGELLVKDLAALKESACEHCGARFVGALLRTQHQRAAAACAAKQRDRRRAQVDRNKARARAVCENREALELRQLRQQRKLEEERRRQERTAERLRKLEMQPRTSRRIHQMFHDVTDANQNGDGGVRADTEEDLLYCDECHKVWMGDCPKHGPLNVVEDQEDYKIGAKADPRDRAAATLPAGLCLQLQPPGLALQDGAGTDEEQDDVFGVWADSPVPRRTLFGPYQGDAVVVSGIKAATAAPANWMGLVRRVVERGGPAASAEANLRPLEYCDRLYFRTTRYIPAGEELVVRFASKESACEHCGARFSDALLQSQHQRAAAACAAKQRDRRRSQVNRNKARVVYCANDGDEVDNDSDFLVKSDDYDSSDAEDPEDNNEVRQQSKGEAPPSIGSTSSAALPSLEEQPHASRASTESLSYRCTECGTKFGDDEGGLRRHLQQHIDYDLKRVRRRK